MSKINLNLEFNDLIKNITYNKSMFLCSIEGELVEGVLEFIFKASNKYNIVINPCMFSKRVINNWLIAEYVKLADTYHNTPIWLRDHIEEYAFADPWEYEAEYYIKHFVKRNIKHPLFRSKDNDNNVFFKGDFTNIDELLCQMN
jgi:hypothetical protein